MHTWWFILLFPSTFKIYFKISMIQRKEICRIFCGYFIDEETEARRGLVSTSEELGSDYSGSRV